MYCYAMEVWLIGVIWMRMKFYLFSVFEFILFLNPIEKS